MTTKPCNIPCPKCGSDDINRLFNAKGVYVKAEAYNECSNKYASGQCHFYQSTRDHIAHHCRCCHYEWQTLPLPKKPKS